MMSIGGYAYDVVDETYKEFECPVCRMLLRDAIELHCGHCLCESCLQQIEVNNKSAKQQCPQCRTVYKNDEKVSNKTINRVIRSSIQIKCENNGQGCDWKGVISNLKDHLDRVCIYAKLQCPIKDCEDQSMRKDMDKHKSICPYRDVKCRYCYRLMPKNQMEVHHEECEHFPIPCTNEGCDEVLKRFMMGSHSKLCKHAVIYCTFRSVSCSDKIKRKDLNDHLATNINKHMFLMLRNNEYNQISRFKEVQSLKLKLELANRKIIDLETKQNQLEVTNLKRSHSSNQGSIKRDILPWSNEPGLFPDNSQKKKKIT